jgi:hypothetical protein
MLCSIKIFILLAIAITLIFIYFYTKPLKIPKYMFNKSNYAPSKKGFTGVLVKDLIQGKNFYKKFRDDTIRYLLGVYPTAKESFEQLGYLELASFYNSLTYYYNCSFEYPSLGIGPLPCKEQFPLPYPPQGWFFNFYTYQTENIPYIYSDSDETKPALAIKNFGSGRPGIAFMHYSDTDKAGPGTFWLKTRTILRNIWYPNGLSFTKKNGKLDWKFVMNQRITWNYPQNWFKGNYNNEYIEVTHTQPVPGLVQSLGWWWNGVAGSGIFLNLGKSLKCINKLDAAYLLLKMMKPELLLQWYKTTDIYEILFGIIGYCGYDKSKDIKYCDFRWTDCAFWCDNNYQGVLETSKLPLYDFYKETIRFQNANGISYSSIPTREGIIASIEAARKNQDYRLGHVATKVLLDESLFFWGMNTNFDTIEMVYSNNGNGYFGYELIDLRIPEKYKEKAKLREYSDFIVTKNPSNEPWSKTSNDNYYKKEFIQEWVQKFITEEIVSVRDPLDIYNKSKVSKCQIASIFSKICPNNIQFDETWYSFNCENSPLNDAYKCLSLGTDVETKNKCILSGDNPTC